MSRRLVVILLATVLCACTSEVGIESIVAEGSIAGRVTTLGGAPIGDAVVRVVDREFTTDADGEYAFVGLPPGDLAVTVRSARHSMGHVPVVLRDRDALRVDLRLLETLTTEVADASVGGLVETADGVVIDLPGGSLFDADGRLVQGPVEVRTALFQHPRSLLAAPGGMLASGPDGDLLLESFGMVDVQIEQHGEPVTFDGRARLEIPLSASAPIDPGESIGLWHFDEQVGRWEQEGEGSFSEGRFVAEVTHFSVWNCDQPLDTTCIDLVLVDPDGAPVVGVEVLGMGMDYDGLSREWTDEQGQVQLPLRRDSRAWIRGASDGPLGGAFGFHLQIDTPDELSSEGCTSLGTFTVSDTTVDDDGDGYAEQEGDCDDTDAGIFPGAPEVCDHVDDDCDGDLEQGTDRDHDGEGDCLDCDDGDWRVHTQARDRCDGVLDNDCDGIADPLEADLDGDGLSICDGDCVDTSPDVTGQCAFEELVAGWDFTCGLRPDALWVCWGGEMAGVYDPEVPWTTAEAGRDLLCGLREDGLAECMTPEGVWEPQLDGVVEAISVGHDRVCGLRDSGRVRCADARMQQAAEAPSGTYRELALGDSHGCGVGMDELVYCWQHDVEEVLDQLMWIGEFFEHEVVVTLSAGGRHTCALNEDSLARCWGEDDLGQTSPPAGLGFDQLVAGGAHTCGLTAAGVVTCWGDDGLGQASPPPGAFTRIAAGGAHTCGMTADGGLTCWGDDSAGQGTAEGGG